MTDTTETTGNLFGLTPGGGGLAGLLPGRAPKRDAVEPDTSAVPVLPDPFDATPLQRDQVTGTPAERLAVVKDALRRAKLTEMESVRAARVRGRIEAGAALAILVEDELHKEAGYASLDEYATTVLHMDRTAVYEFIKDGKRLALVAPLSKATNRPLLPAQAKVLAPIVETHGQDVAHGVLERAEADGGKVAAASLKAAAQEMELEVATAEKSPMPRRSEPAPLDVLEAGLLVLRDVRTALDKTAFRAGWDAAAAGGEADAERLQQLRAAVSDEARAIGAAARWQPKTP
ncbi:hypothetical protein AB0K86_21875 [Streptomyces clavifer]|uniref:hypothetical protein n=1 Tax=Actinomycetes TaxID=1760 RepID=UPI0007004DF0|nr:hypothetical protein [Streptomyces sp. Root55]KQZ17914.1 hypothetical protein ASD51_31045 [Streptomyces sp. Root55]